ncbi:MerR family DNA-binding protein [Streptomyces sp. KLOTTS4A1]|uniref:MerR family DNA-binding protein n=1 Tax=Streptomyces sp. KLOTTS4A1 TaxID=3390996 RepID=UPI0039F57DA1
MRSILLLRDRGQVPCAQVTRLIDGHLAEIDERLRELRRTRSTLRALAARAAGTDPAECAEAGVCTILESSVE